MEKSNSPRPIGAGNRRAQYAAYDPIVVHRSVIPGETAISLASWTAALNGLSLRGLCRDFAIKHSDLVAGHRSAISQLAELTGSDASQLLWHSPRHLAVGLCSLMSETVRASVLLKTPNRICPVCIANNCAGKDQSRAFQVWEWQLEPFRRCRMHDVMLEPLLPAKDPHDFAAAIQAWEPRVIRSSPCIDPRFEEYLVKRIESGAGASWPDSLPMHVVILFCEAFGAMLGFGSDCSFEALSDEQKIEASALGFHHVAQGPEAIQSALQDFYDEAVTYKTTYGKLLAPVLKVLSSNAKDPAFDGLRDLVREFLRENFHIPDGTDTLCHAYAHKAELDLDGLSSHDFYNRLTTACVFRWGLVIELLIDACIVVLSARRKELIASDFCKAFSDATGLRPGYSPFSVEDYEVLFEPQKIFALWEGKRI